MPGRRAKEEKALTVCCFDASVCLFSSFTLEYSKNAIFSSKTKNKSSRHFSKKKEEEEEEEEDEEKLVSRDKRHVFWSDDASAEKADRGERGVEFDRE